MAGGGRISNVVGQGYLGAQIAGTIFDSALIEHHRHYVASYLSQKWALSIPIIYRKFTDHSGGDQDLVFIGDDESGNQKFNQALDFDGENDFLYFSTDPSIETTSSQSLTI